MESMTTPDDNLLLGMETTLQTSGSNPLVPHINPSGQQDIASLRKIFPDTLWQGGMFYQPEKVKLPLRYNMFSRVTSTEKLFPQHAQSNQSVYQPTTSSQLKLREFRQQNGFRSKMESMATPDEDLLQGMETTSQTSGSNPLVPQLNPSGQQDFASLRETFVYSLWQGLLVYESQKVELSLISTICSRVTSKEKLCADKWPKLLRMQLLALFPYCAEIPRRIKADPHSVMIQFSKESEAPLSNILTPGLVRVIVFPATCIEARRLMYLVCLPDNRTLLGSFLEDETQETYIEDEMLPLPRPVVNNSNIQMNASMPVNQQQPPLQDPHQAGAAHYQARMAQCTHAKIRTAHEPLRMFRVRRSRQLHTLPYPQFQPINPILSSENISSISEASCTRGTNTASLISQQPQQQEHQQSQVTSHQTSMPECTDPNNAITVQRNKLRITLKAMCQRGVNSPLTLPCPIFMPNHPVSSLECISRISGSSCARGTNVTSCPVKENSAGSRAGINFKKDLVRKVKREFSRETGRVPRGFKTLCDEILENKPESSGASTNDETVEELMSKLEKCSVLHSSNE